MFQLNSLFIDWVGLIVSPDPSDPVGLEEVVLLDGVVELFVFKLFEPLEGALRLGSVNIFSNLSCLILFNLLSLKWSAGSKTLYLLILEPEGSL